MRQVKELFKRIAARLRHCVFPIRQKPLPRVTTVRTFLRQGCRFKIFNSVEASRVERMSGEQDFLKLLLEELRREDVFFDMGSCVGLFAVHAALSGARVVAFEPEPGIRSHLETNLRLNGLDAVQVVPWAVSNGSGQATLYTDGTAGWSPALRNQGGRGSIPVATRAIDEALDAGEVPTPTFVKMDIEGAEALALRGMSRLLSSSLAPRRIFMEIHPTFLPLFGSSREEVMSMMVSFGYDQFYEAECHNQIHVAFRRQERVRKKGTGTPPTD